MDKVKFQFEMSKEAADRLEALAKEGGVTKKEIINNALIFLDWAIEEVKEGKIIASVDEKEQRYKEIIFPLLASFASEGKSRFVGSKT